MERLIFILLLIAVQMIALAVPGQTAGVRACTQEAKLCPDGSYVTRTGPDCEFAPCPHEKKKSTPVDENPSTTGAAQPRQVAPEKTALPQNDSE